MKESQRVTIRDVSQAVGMSIATVNRALSGKPRVSEQTRQRIVEAARQMGFKANRAAQAMARKPIRIRAVLSESIPEFYNDVADGIRKAFGELSDFGVSSEVVIVPREHSAADSRHDFIDAMEQTADQGAAGLILLPGGDMTDYQGVIDRLWQQGIYTATVVTDVMPSRRIVSVRGNGVCAGRMAAEMLSLLCPGGRVAIFSSSQEVAICRENLAGFTAQARGLALTTAHLYENHDDPDEARAAVDDLAARFPDVDGIYILSANSASACRRLEELGLGRRYAIVSTDLFPEIHHYMERGVIRATLFQSPRHQGEGVVHKLYEHIDTGNTAEEVVLLTPQLVLNSNRDQF